RLPRPILQGPDRAARVASRRRPRRPSRCSRPRPTSPAARISCSSKEVGSMATTRKTGCVLNRNCARSTRNQEFARTVAHDTQPSHAAIRMSNLLEKNSMEVTPLLREALTRIQTEYVEMPHLKLTAQQVRRLW